MASKIVRASKYRQIFGEPAKPEHCFSDLELSPVTGDHNVRPPAARTRPLLSHTPTLTDRLSPHFPQYIRCNTKFFSVSARGGGGPVLVMPFSATGKLPRGYPLINGHAGAVLDTAWNPFNEHCLATGSDDATVRRGGACAWRVREAL